MPLLPPPCLLQEWNRLDALLPLLPPPCLLQEWNHLDALLLVWGKAMLRLDASFHTAVAALISGGTVPPPEVHRRHGPASTAADATTAVQQGDDDGGGLDISDQPGHAVHDSNDDAGGLGGVDLYSHAVHQQVGSEGVWMLNTGALEVSHKMHIDLHQVGVCMCGGGVGGV